MAYDKIYEENPERTLVPAGTYECIISAEEKKSDFTGQVQLNLSFRIRKGIGQANEGRIVFEKVNHDKNYPDEYNHNVISSILKTVEEKKSFSTNDDLIQFLNGLCVTAQVIVEPANEYHQSDKNKVSLFRLAPAKTAPTEEEKKEFGLGEYAGSVSINKASAGLPDVSDDDLPF